MTVGNQLPPARGSDPSDEQLHALMRAALADARARAEVADRALQAAVNEEVEKVRQRYLAKRTP
ncbi:hypothetical protein [Ramlibacter sp. 2FC]|uniref:hypothetical protein n=1 Tax=Ramlibacter sp. 2FC TaxID=2502188 RepID=UPI0010F60A33|nr:hypothetical protein [Ramlibacter sp. 2FC]